MHKIWVIELQCNRGNWFPATSANFTVLAFSSFYAAHKERKLHYRYLKSVAPKVWTWKRIRVRQWNSPVEIKVETGNVLQQA